MSSYGQRRLRPMVRRWRQRLDNPEVKAGRLLVQQLDVRPADILHFGASESLFVADADADTRTLPQMVQDALSDGVVFTSTAGPTYHPRLIRSFLRLVAARGAPDPVIVVVAILIRSSRLPWALHPAYRYDRAITAMDRIGRRRPVPLIRAVIGLPTERQMERHDRARFPSVLGDLAVGEYRRPLKQAVSAGTDREPWLQLLYAYHHGGVEGPGADWLDNVTEMARAIRATGATAIVYHPPIPVQRGEQLLGARVRAVNQAAIDAARVAFLAGDPDARFAGSPLDYATSDFIDPDDATEHLNEHGRQRLAREIVEQIRQCHEAFVAPG